MADVEAEFTREDFEAIDFEALDEDVKQAVYNVAVSHDSTEIKKQKLAKLFRPAEPEATQRETPDMAWFSASKMQDAISRANSVQVDARIEELETQLPTLPSPEDREEARQLLAAERYKRDQLALDTSQIGEEEFQATGVQTKMDVERAMLEERKLLAEGFREDSVTVQQARLAAQAAMNAATAWQNQANHREVIGRLDQDIVDSSRAMADTLRHQDLQQAKAEGRDASELEALATMSLEQVNKIRPDVAAQYILRARDAVEADRGERVYSRYLKEVTDQYGEAQLGLESILATPQGVVQDQSSGDFLAGGAHYREGDDAVRQSAQEITESPEYKQWAKQQ